jgi:hypothetical protein
MSTRLSSTSVLVYQLLDTLFFDLVQNTSLKGFLAL